MLDLKFIRENIELVKKGVASTPTGLSISLVAPNKILAGYATNIVIKGSGFKQGAKVDFGSGAIQVPFGITNSEQITALIPAGMPPLTYNLAVINPDGQIVVFNDALTIQVAPPPATNSLTTSQITSLVSPATVQIKNDKCSVGGYCTGSGVIFDESGYILTNHHVIENDDAVEVKLNDGRVVSGMVLGWNAIYDLAVVKTNVLNISSATLGDSGLVALGEKAVALGYPLTGFPGIMTVAEGIISSKGKTDGYGVSYVQTSAPIQSGSSGGPLVNAKGEVVGINTLCIQLLDLCVDDLRYAVEINHAKLILADLKSGVRTGAPASIPTPSPSPTPSPTPTPQVSSLTTSTNFGFAGSTSSTPTGVKGAMNAKIASFVITAGSGEGADVSQIVVKNSATAGLALGHDFQNLTLKNGSSQIGTTVGSLSTTLSNTYTFTSSPMISLNAGQQYVVDVYADILTNAVNIGTAPYSAVILDSVTATGKSTNSDASSGTDRNGQNIYIADTGSLKVTAGSDMPIAQNRSMGQTGQILATFKLTTGAQEAVNISSIVVTDTLAGTATAATGSITNLSLWNSAGVQVGSTVSSMSASAGMDVIATFNGLTLNIAKDKAEVLTLKGDINTYPNAVSGSRHTFAISENAAVTAVGATSGQTISMTGAGIAGTAQRAYRAELTIASAMSNFSGGAGTDQNVAKYRFTNTSAGNYTITVTDIDLGLSTTMTGSALTATRYVTLKRDSVSGTVIAKKGFRASFSDITDWTVISGDSSEVPFQSFTIDASSGTGYVDIYVLIDTLDATSTRTLSTSLGSGSNVITWSDGVSSNITSVDGTAVNGATVTY